MLKWTLQRVCQQLCYAVEHFRRVLARLENVRVTFHVQTAQMLEDSLQPRERTPALTVQYDNTKSMLPSANDWWSRTMLMCVKVHPHPYAEENKKDLSLHLKTRGTEGTCYT